MSEQRQGLARWAVGLYVTVALLLAAVVFGLGGYPAPGLMFAVVAVVWMLVAREARHRAVAKVVRQTSDARRG